MGYITPYVPMPEVVDVGYSTPKNYQIRIYSDRGETIIANLPESIQISLGSEWDQPFNKPLTDRIAESNLFGSKSGTVGAAANLAEKVTGFSSQSKYLSVSVWTQGTGLSLDLPLVFRAFNDPVKDVTDKIVRLLQMTTPDETSVGTLVAPGPVPLGEAARALGVDIGMGETITVELGNFIRLSPVIVRQVSSDIITQYDINGNPMSATVTVSIQTPYVVTKKDIIQFFLQHSARTGA